MDEGGILEAKRGVNLWMGTETRPGGGQATREGGPHPQHKQHKDRQEEGQTEEKARQEHQIMKPIFYQSHPAAWRVTVLN